MSSMLLCTGLIMFDLSLTKPHMFYMLQKDASKTSRKLHRSWTGLEHETQNGGCNQSVTQI